MAEQIKVISWNTGHSSKSWDVIINSDADLWLLQEATEPNEKIVQSILEVDHSPWRTTGWYIRPWRTAIVRGSNKVSMSLYKAASIEAAKPGELAVSRVGTISVADVQIKSTGEIVTFASIYGVWENPIHSDKSRDSYADASIHRIISDLSYFLDMQQKRKIIIAGDMNVFYGYGDNGNPYWKARYDSIFIRMEGLGLNFIGPQSPHGGNQAIPKPSILPENSKNIPTRGIHQLDYVFASIPLIDRIKVRAINGDDEWGPSDHCRIEINLQF
jgi:exonuclease III